MQHTSDTTINVGYMYMAQWLIITCVEDSSLILMSLKPNPQKSDTHSSWVQNPKASCLSTTFLLGCYYSQSTRVISWCFCDWPKSQSVWRWHGLCCHVRTLDEVAIIDLDIYYHFHITTSLGQWSAIINSGIVIIALPLHSLIICEAQPHVRYAYLQHSVAVQNIVILFCHIHDRSTVFEYYIIY